MAIFHPIAPVLYEGRPGGWERRSEGYYREDSGEISSAPRGVLDRGQGH